ncbi:hypothetical protein QN372_18845 [Undibacterium sp. RTI2.1]|uniref:hypothetical protein n=1 Tax=unclassified Undibacterium TaxID=2630295 RepID=UPI002AB4199C|nr:MULTISPECIES: hypothetical protein [unclassified Undibacterium]MDY7539954.1 hypothetical protein [Undibacterium sp. 5I1]MEB0032811.1 hypothetical protein [Undibacterium sp. RTI2.1]MEB0116465.1 hypothetical protein [Undibacterium sp. RTI2.2]MEB0230561.1 hypothetical protein [Undibacterium sp. 10I3]MEB0257259.1 hypothetical protein [Undibacterium sp. 5I1]
MQLQLKQWAPFARPEFAIIFEQNAALVWCWDAAWLAQQRQELPKLWMQAQAIPESALYPLQESGVRLVKCFDGAEAQCWQDKQLIGSRWWPQTPVLDDYVNFCREVGYTVAGLEKLPAIQSLSIQAQPWEPVISGGGLTGGSPAIEQWLYAVLFLCVAFPYGWYTLRQQQISNAIEQNRQELSKLTGQANSLIQAREKALKAIEEIKTRQQLDPYPSQLDLMSAVAETLPTDTRIREWEFQEGKLRIVIMPGLEVPSRADITKALLNTGRFIEVQNLLARDQKSLAFRMTVLPKPGVVLPQDNLSTDGKGKNG